MLLQLVINNKLLFLIWSIVLFDRFKGCYANVPDRDWETFDGSLFRQEYKDLGCKDIADQLITENSFINVK